jgi:hypothetical protein
MNMHAHTHHRRVLLAIAPVALALALSACGSASSGKATHSAAASSGSSSTTAAGGASTPGHGSFLAQHSKLVACLKKHGVTLPSFHRPAAAGGAPAGGGFFFGAGAAGSHHFAPDPKLRAALSACGASFAHRGDFTRSGAAFKKRLDSFFACVKRHGYTLPAPNLSGKGSVFPVSIEHNKHFQAAAKPCVSLLRSPPPSSPSG